MSKPTNGQQKNIKKKAMNRFRAIAEDSMTLSRLHNGNEKLETEDVTDQPLTIQDFDMVYTDKATYAVVTFVEKPKAFYNCGLILTKMVQAWIEDYDSLDDAVAEYEALDDAEKVKVQLTEGKAASSKNNLVLVTLL